MLTRCEYDKALEYCEKALSIRRRLLMEGHPDIANSYHNIEKIRKAKGGQAMAKENCFMTQENRDIVNGDDNLSVAGIENDAGVVLSVDGSLTGENDDDDVPEGDSGSDGGDDLAVAEKCKELGDSLCKKGDYREAFANYRKALDIYLRIYGEDDGDVDDCYDGIITACRKYGDNEAAQKYYEESMAIYFRQVRKDHPVWGKVVVWFYEKLIFAPTRWLLKKTKEREGR